MGEGLPEMKREEFLRILWERFCDESKSHHPNTLRYGQLLIEMQEWNEPSEQQQPEISVKIGGYI